MMTLSSKWVRSLILLAMIIVIAIYEVILQQSSHINQMFSEKSSSYYMRDENVINIPEISIDSLRESQFNRRLKEKDAALQAQASALVSPTNGTDISRPFQLIKVYNQSQAIVPKLELQRKFDVYFCKHKGYGVRFYFLSREGLLLHPNINLVDDPDKAEFIVYLPVSADWKRTECNKPEYKHKTIVLDEGDGPHLFEPSENPDVDWFLYFKRSFVRRQNGVFHGYMGYLQRGNIFPMTYTMAEAYIKLEYNLMQQRDLELVCTLRGSAHDPTRLRIREWVEEYVKARGIKQAVAGEVNAASRTVVSNEYFSYMYRARIIVTSNPSDWEGDFRFCEALSSGALIFIDHMYVPRPNPFLHNQHVIYYDNMNKTDLFDKLDYYREKRKLTAQLAAQGYLHGMKYHRAASLTDFIFKTAHIKLTKEKNPEDLPRVEAMYTQTGYDMWKIAHNRQLKINAEKKKQH